jgi:nucleotide-binding universal stress UspA family protein
MTAQRIRHPGRVRDRHVLVALDESDMAEKAVLYVGDFLGGVPGFRVTLLTIIPEPSEDYFNTDEERAAWIEHRRAEALKLLEKYRQILVHSGFRKSKVEVRVDITKSASLADCILDRQKALDCCTVVVGRRGISRKEEFMFGSTSSRILHTGRNCAVWVIEAGE